MREYTKVLNPITRVVKKVNAFLALKMIGFRSKKLFSFFKHEASLPIYEIVEIEDNNDFNYVKFRIVLKAASVITMDPEEIAANDDIIFKFSKQDIRVITYFAAGNKFRRALKVEKNEMAYKSHQLLDSGEWLITLEIKATHQLIFAKANHIYTNASIYNNLSSSDAIKIGYLAGGWAEADEHRQVHEFRNRDSV